MTEDEINALLIVTKTALTAVLVNPKPTYKIGEYAVQHTAHLKSLRDTITWCGELLSGISCQEETLWRFE